VLILKKNNTVGGTFIEDKSVCNGSDPAKLTCTVRSSDLINKFNYRVADKLIAVVKACNKVGCSDQSVPNTGSNSTQGQVRELNNFSVGGRRNRN